MLFPFLRFALLPLLLFLSHLGVVISLVRSAFYQVTASLPSCKRPPNLFSTSNFLFCLNKDIDKAGCFYLYINPPLRSFFLSPLSLPSSCLPRHYQSIHRIAHQYFSPGNVRLSQILLPFATNFPFPFVFVLDLQPLLSLNSNIISNNRSAYTQHLCKQFRHNEVHRNYRLAHQRGSR